MEFQMRNKTFISSMVLSVACVSAANAGVVDTLANPQSTYNTFMTITGGLFDQRELIKSGGGSGSVASGSTNFVPNSTNMPAFGLGYRQVGASMVNLSGLALSFDIIAGGGSYKLEWNIVDSTGKAAEMVVASVQTGTLTFLATNTDAGFNLASIEEMSVVFGQGSSSTGVLSNFNFTAVPAPGALALLGVAGLVGARRRRA
jgi:MYXO-CTERM domain-containing protein